MYTLYYSPGTCAVATQVVLHELDQDVTIIDKNHLNNFGEITGVGEVPVLRDGDKTLREGAAIILYLLNKHQNSMLPVDAEARQAAIQDIMFANATMHPAYSKLFFIAKNITDEQARQEVLNAAADAINALWTVVEQQLTDKAFLGGNHPSAADIMLTVYSTWGQYFPVDIRLGKKTAAMLKAVQAMPSFVNTVEAQRVESAKSLTRGNG